MDPPPLPIAPTTAISATSMHLNYPESVESSPRSRHENTIDDQPLPAVPGARLRLMCSFGGHIMPRPHDKSLCYVGGETRLVAVDRHCSLSAFCNRLSRALLNGRPFSLKYQLPNEDLDSLVSVATDEDLENMIDEYDRLTASSTSSLSSCRIRLFLFFNRPDTAASMGPLLNDMKSETWMEVLNCRSRGSAPLKIRGSSDNLNRILSDDERSDQGVPVGFRKPPLPLQPLPLQQRPSGGYNNLPSPDSVASDSSIASANSLSKNMYYQDQSHVVSRDNRAAINPTTSADTSIPSSQIQMQQVQDSYALAPQLDQQQQQQYIHYIPHPTAPHAPVAMSSYYPVYAAPSQQQKLHHPVDHQQYPAVYMMPVTQVTQPQPYMSMQSNAGVMTMKSNVTDASIVAPSRPLTPPNPSIVAASAAYKEAAPPIFPANTATLANPEMAATVYRTAVPSTAQVVQVQQPYVGYSQMQHPPQQVAVNPAANYGYEYPNPTQDQMFYAQHQASPLPPQYQTMTQAAAAAALADASKQQLPTDSNNQQIRISQPL
ncbi:Phox/Bem1p [Corchorus olitorius]|uniref:Phox/Bem1p n=1 Tax=Corchorus olitorius TaxID=93759 RepID=A0A1R3FUQ1_9ROSI|nr:Phox/Bem1p [Corchorus olitorius]